MRRVRETEPRNSGQTKKRHDRPTLVTFLATRSRRLPLKRTLTVLHAQGIVLAPSPGQPVVADGLLSPDHLYSSAARARSAVPSKDSTHARSPLATQDRRFTLVELMIVITIVIGAAAIGFPAFSKWVKQSKVEFAANSAQNLCALARQTAIRNGVPTVMAADLVRQEFFVFSNVDRDSGYAYAPDPSATNRTVDYEVARVPLPQDAQVSFGGPGSTSSGGGGGNGNGGGNGGGGNGGGGNGGGSNSTLSWVSPAAIVGLSPSTAGSNVAVFMPDGSIADRGGAILRDTESINQHALHLGDDLS